MKVTRKNIETDKEKVYNNVYRVNVRWYKIYLWIKGVNKTVSFDKKEYMVFIKG